MWWIWTEATENSVNRNHRLDYKNSYTRMSVIDGKTGRSICVQLNRINVSKLQMAKLAEKEQKQH